MLDQPATDWPIRVAVLIGIGDAQLTATVELDATRSLDLQELQVHRVGQPGHHRRLDALALDGGCIVIGFEHATFEPAPQAFAFEFRINAVQSDDDHVFRHAIHRDVRRCGLGQAAGVHRFVVAGDQAVGVIVGGAQAVDIKVLLEKTTNLAGGLRDVGRRCAGRAPDRVSLESVASAAPRAETGDKVVIRHRRQRFPRGTGVGGQGVGFRFVVVTTGAACEQGHHRQGPGQAVTPRLETAVHGVISFAGCLSAPCAHATLIDNRAIGVCC